MAFGDMVNVKKHSLKTYNVCRISNVIVTLAGILLLPLVYLADSKKLVILLISNELGDWDFPSPF